METHIFFSVFCLCFAFFCFVFLLLRWMFETNFLCASRFQFKSRILKENFREENVIWIKKIYVYISQILDNTEVTNAEDPFGYKQLNKHNVHEIHCYTKYHLLPQEGSWWGEVNGEIYEVSTKRSPTN